MRPTARTVALTVACLYASGCDLSGEAAQGRPRLTRAHDWTGRGEWVAADLHVHTRFSDGAHTVDEVVAKARESGCGAVAITDHADARLTAATTEYEAAIGAARKTFPDMAIVAGLEWNIPPWGGEEHATVLAPAGPGEWTLLAGLKQQFDDFQLDGKPKPDARAALAWLATASQSAPPVVIYNHPSRPDAKSIENVADLTGWREVNSLVTGFEGAPGHQRYKPIGGYKYLEKPIDRWDPAAARPGDAWDTLLQRGLDIHAAQAGSDFHNASPSGMHDFWPCQFAETWLYVPERSPAGVLRALRAGSFFAAHGHVARHVEIAVTTPGLPRAAMAGEAIEARAGSALTVTVDFAVPERDWEQQPNEVDTVDLMIITSREVAVRTLPVSGRGRQRVTDTLVVPPGGVVVRARGRRVIDNGDDLMFYTNAVRIAAGK